MTRKIEIVKNKTILTINRNVKGKDCIITLKCNSHDVAKYTQATPANCNEKLASGTTYGALLEHFCRDGMVRSTITIT
jgi:hypothetical protein